MAVRFFLFDDEVARGWLPFTLTRPAGEILFGTETLRARSERVLGLSCGGHLANEDLQGFDEPGAPRCLPPSTIEAGDRLFLSSRFVAAEGASVVCSQPALLVAGPEPVGAWVPEGTPFPGSLATGRLPEWPAVSVDGTVLESVWALMARNEARIRADGERFQDTELPGTVQRLGDGKVAVGSGAVIEPGTIFDTTAGPVILAPGVRVQAPSRLAGPTYVGTDSVILGGFVTNTSIGPSCKIRGEVESSIIFGFTNKAHEGFLGHSVVGRWVNLGALTTNSDLKNNYGSVRFEVNGRSIDTGLTKAGCLLGDHVKTGIGTLINSGTVVGVGSNVFGGRMPPKFVPPFSWGTGDDLEAYDVDRFLTTTARVMARRGVKLTSGMRHLFRRAFAETAPLRARQTVR